MRTPSNPTRVALLLASFLTLSAFARPQMPAKSRKAAASPNAEISGTITDAATGRPIAGAQVMVFSPWSGIMGGVTGGVAGGVIPVPLIGCPCDHWGSPGTLRYQTLTDARGRFAFRKAIPGTYQVSAVAPGYAEQSYQVKRGDNGLNLTQLRPGQRRSDIDIRLPRQAVLTGRIIDEHGQPVPSAYVRVMQRRRSTWNPKKLLPVTATVTDDRGEYRLFGLLPGHYYLEARYQPGFDLASFSPGRIAKRFLLAGQTMPFGSLGSYSPLFFYPGTINSAEAKPVVVRAGQVRSGLDISVRPLTPAERAKLKPQPPRPRRGDCEESGTVTNAVTGQPLKRAWVLLGPANGATQPPIFGKTSTDANGRFAFRGIACYARHPLLAWKNGFAENFLSFPSAPSPGIVGLPNSHWKIDDVHFALVPTGVITGRITDAHGKPAACVRVELVRYGDSNHRANVRYPMRDTVTDDRGRYRFFQLPPGRYIAAAQIRYAAVVATLAPMNTDSPSGPQPRTYYASPYVYYPHTANLTKAKAIRVAPGAEVKGIDFSVKSIETYSISGAVKGPALQAVGRGLRVVLATAKSRHGLPLDLHQQSPNASGEFRISGVVPGSYVLWATAFIHKRWDVAWTPITIRHQNIAGVALDPHLGWSIPVHLRVEGQPHGYFRYIITAQEQDDPPVAQTAGTQPMSASGTSEMTNLFPGRYIVRVGVRHGKPTPFRQRFPFRYVTRPPPNWYIKSARFGAQDVRTGMLTVKMKKPKGTLDLTVSWRGARVLGTVVDSHGKPAYYATVVLVPAKKSERPWWLVRYAPLYEGNHFLLAGVPPGRYLLFAWKNVGEGTRLRPAFLKRAAKQGLVINLSEGESKKLKLRAVPAPILPRERNP